jgi:hypothetical protein
LVFIGEKYISVVADSTILLSNTVEVAPMSLWIHIHNAPMFNRIGRLEDLLL